MTSGLPPAAQPEIKGLGRRRRGANALAAVITAGESEPEAPSASTTPAAVTPTPVTTPHVEAPPVVFPTAGPGRTNLDLVERDDPTTQPASRLTQAPNPAVDEANAVPATPAVETDRPTSHEPVTGQPQATDPPFTEQVLAPPVGAAASQPRPHDETLTQATFRPAQVEPARNEPAGPASDDVARTRSLEQAAVGNDASTSPERNLAVKERPASTARVETEDVRQVLPLDDDSSFPDIAALIGPDGIAQLEASEQRQQTAFYVERRAVKVVKALRKVDGSTYDAVILQALETAVSERVLARLLQERLTVRPQSPTGLFPARRVARSRTRRGGDTRIALPAQMTPYELALLDKIVDYCKLASRSVLVSTAVEWYTTLPRVRRRVAGVLQDDDE